MKAGETERTVSAGKAEQTAIAGKTVGEGLWYEKGLRFRCTQCGNCCSGATGIVDFTPRELEIMAEYLNLLPQEFLDRYARRRRGWWCLKEVFVEGTYDCVFLRRDPESGRAHCDIYDVRPSQCRTWPFWDENLRSPGAWREAGEDCPGIRNGGADGGAGKLYPLEEIRRIAGKGG